LEERRHNAAGRAPRGRPQSQQRRPRRRGQQLVGVELVEVADPPRAWLSAIARFFRTQVRTGVARTRHKPGSVLALGVTLRSADFG
jgi:hypothetical protein